MGPNGRQYLLLRRTLHEVPSLDASGERRARLAASIAQQGQLTPVLVR